MTVYIEMLNECSSVQQQSVYTFSASIVCISRTTSIVALSSLFVTRRGIQTVTTTVVDTAITIGTVITFCEYDINNKFCSYCSFYLKNEC